MGIRPDNIYSQINHEDLKATDQCSTGLTWRLAGRQMGWSDQVQVFIQLKSYKGKKSLRKTF